MYQYIPHDSGTLLTLLGPQSRFGDKLLIIRANCPQIWERGAKGVKYNQDNTLPGTSFRADFLPNDASNSKGNAPIENDGLEKLSSRPSPKGTTIRCESTREENNRRLKSCRDKNEGTYRGGKGGEEPAM